MHASQPAPAAETRRGGGGGGIGAHGCPRPILPGIRRGRACTPSTGRRAPSTHRRTSATVSPWTSGPDSSSISSSTPGAAGLADRDPGWTGGPDFADLARTSSRQRAKEASEAGIEELSDAQELLWASDPHAVLVVLQAMDAAGKDSTIKHVMSGVNPQGVQVFSFKQPVRRRSSTTTSSGASSKALPERGPHRHLQPLALRGGRRAAGAPRVARARSASRRAAPTTSVLGRSATRTSTPSSATSTATGRRSSSSSSTSPRRSRRSGSSRASTSPTRSGSSTRPTSPSERAGTTTSAPSRMRSPRPRRRGRRGT